MKGDDDEAQRFTEEQIIAILREQEAGSTTADVCREHGVSSTTVCKWKAKTAWGHNLLPRSHFDLVGNFAGFWALTEPVGDRRIATRPVPFATDRPEADLAGFAATGDEDSGVHPNSAWCKSCLT